jgi:diguanylate cyclase (GGDEF)-like protein/PAS domain S-box-containing protein
MLTDGPFLVLREGWGWWYWINVGHAYCIILLGAGIMVRFALDGRMYRQQQAAILLGVFIPLAASVAYIAGYSPLPGVDPIPVTAPISGILFAWAQFRYRFLDAVPLARAAIVERMLDGMVVLDANQRVIDINPAAARILHVDGASVIGKPATHLQPIERLLGEHGDMARGETTRRGEIGTLDDHLHEIVCSPLIDKDGSLRATLVMLRDVTAQRRLEQRLRFLAHFDSLTSLPNRAQFEDRLDIALHESSLSGLSLAVLFIDLDGFKIVNDSLGHSVGDGLLVAVANRVQSAVRDGDMVARIGGDEFVVLLERLPASHADEMASEIVHRIREQLRTPVVIHGHQVTTRASIGMAVGNGSASPGELLRTADHAMYAEKREHSLTR